MPVLSTLGAAIANVYGFTSGLIKDQYFNLVSLLLPGNGTNGAQNNTFLDSGTANSGSGFTITRNGNTTQGTFSPFSQTGWGNRFDGATSTRLTLASGTDFAFGTGAYTMEAWVYLTAYSSAGNVIFDCGSATGSIGLSVTSTGEAQLNKYGTGAIVITAASAVPLNAWTHIAVTRFSTSTNETRIFINGSLSQTGTDNNNWTVTTTPSIGGYGLANYTVNGFISNLSVLKGTAKYTSAFTPATTPLPTNTANQVLLACQANRFIDANTATTAKTLTVNGSPSVTPFSPFAPTQSYSAAAVGGSGYFDGTGDYLTAADNAAFTLGTSDFTIEAWVYALSSGTTDRYFIAHADNASAAGSSFAFYIFSGTSKIYFECYISSTTTTITSDSAIVLNQWNHVAICRSSGTLAMFVNGTRQASPASIGSSSINNCANSVSVGARTTGGSTYTGYLSSSRMVVGTDVYGAGNSTITVPTSPLTAVTNTQFLLNFTNAGVVDATAKNVLETVGNAQISTTQSKWGGGSIYVDGTGDGLFSDASPTINAMTLGTGDFCIEFWVYFNSLSGTPNLLDMRPVATQGVYPSMYVDTSKVSIYVNSATLITGTTTMSTGQWYHIAWSRISGQSALYVGGTRQGASSTADTNNYLCSRVVFGIDRGLSANPVNGYFDDIRITKGNGRGYTGASITVPSAPFPVQ